MKGSKHTTTPPPHLPAADDTAAGDNLSGAYIRSLVKHLTPSTPPKTQPQARAGAGAGPHKKQVRRRLHTTRPYQERLLNMAEARKEIVTALKLHRAAMRQQPPPAQPEPAPILSDGFAALPSQALGLNLSLDPAGFAAAAFNTPAAENGGAAVEGAPAGEAGGEAGWRDSEMLEEIKWIGEMHEMEWNDSVNLAWWFNFQEEDDCYYRQALEFPLVGSDPYRYRMSNNEEIEGLDEEWLS